MIPNLKAKLRVMGQNSPKTTPEPEATPAACRVLRGDYAFGEGLSSREVWEGLALDALSLVIREELPKNLSFRDFCFVDTETTGLSTGAGTVAFLVGVGYFTDAGFRVEQYFLDELDEEGDMLTRLSQRLASFRAIVSYNGRNYDLPLLTTRFLMNRMRPKFPATEIDLLYPARRYFRGRYESCSLSILEGHLLGVTRSEDIPGSQIPAAYYAYLESRDDTQMRLVLSHNRQDLLSLAELMRFLSELQAGAEAGSDPYLQLVCARNALEMGRNDLAEKLLILATKGDVTAAEELVWLYKRKGDFESAYAVCRACTDAGRGSLELWELQAKLEEHQRRDYRAAIASCQGAMAYLPKRDAGLYLRWVHRFHRLVKKEKQ